MDKNNLEIVKDFLKALSDGKSGDEITCFYDPEATQIEYPNLLTKGIVKRNLQDLHESSIKGTKVLTKQTIEIVKSYSLGDTVIIESIWTGKLAVGEEVKAYFAQFYEFRNGKILVQKNYDCFENFL